jgi:hypothetical protein
MSKEFRDPATKARWLDHSFDAITDLEPRFDRVYDFGHSYLTIVERAAKGSADRAIRLLEKGIRHDPGSAGLLVSLAMVHYTEKKDRERTIACLLEARKRPGFDSLSGGMLASLLSKDREDFVALGIWVEPMESGSGQVRRVATLEFWRTKAAIAARAAREFEASRGRKPSAPGEIATAEFVEERCAPVIAEGLEVGRDGVPRYPRLDELEHEHLVLQAEKWSRAFRDELGRWPTLDDFRDRGFGLPRPPAGRRWCAEGGSLRLEGE